MAKLTVKDKVLQYLSENINVSISGEELAKIIGVSRAAVWKSVGSLKEDGYEIKASTNKGYRLLEKSDVLTNEGILNAITFVKKPIVHCYKTIDSTNTEAKKLCESSDGAMIVVSEEQTAGRGRLGRSFYSPKKTGIYMSIVLKPNMQISSAVLVTTAVSVAVCKAIEKISKHEPRIKWVNDIYLNSKKVCGILTEATSNFELGIVENLIIGIGVNISQNEGMPQELSEIATSLFEDEFHGICRNDIVAAIYDEVCEILENDFDKANFMEEYRKYSFIIGEEIKFFKNSEWTNAKAINIDDMGGLVVELPSGKTEVLNSGEISVRKLN